MGDPRKHRKIYSTPSHPWNKDRLDTEKEYVKKYGLSNKKEIYKVESNLRSIKLNAKRLLRTQGTQRDIEHEQMMTRLKSLGLLNVDSTDDSILSLNTSDLLDRRLQSIVFKKGLANSMKQARQFIVHEHIMVGDKKITSPSYIISITEESNISFSPGSKLANEDHPERKIEKDKIKQEVEATKPKVDEKRLLEEDIAPEETISENEIEIKVEESIEDIEKAAEETSSSETEKVAEETEKVVEETSSPETEKSTEAKTEEKVVEEANSSKTEKVEKVEK